jgi:hypothetical protein
MSELQHEHEPEPEPGGQAQPEREAGGREPAPEGLGVPVPGGADGLARWESTKDDGRRLTLYRLGSGR